MYEIRFNGKMYDLINGKTTCRYTDKQIDAIVVTGSKDLCEFVMGKNRIHPNREYSIDDNTPELPTTSNKSNAQEEAAGEEEVKETKSTTQKEFEKWLDEQEEESPLDDGFDNEDIEEDSPYKWRFTNYGNTYGNGELHCWFNDFETIWKIIGEDGNECVVCRTNRKTYA